MIIVHHNNNYSNNNTINEQCTRVMTIMPELFQRERERESAGKHQKRDVSTLTYQNHPKPGKSHGFSTKKGFFILNGWIYRKYGFPKTRGVIIQWTMTGQEGTIRMISFKKRSFWPLLDQINPENIRFGSNTILPIKTLNSNKLP